MPLGYRLLSLSNILAPVSITSVVFLRQESDFVSRLWPWLALFSWLVIFLDVLTYLRGYLARRRGIRPEEPENQPNSSQRIAGIVFYTVVFCFLVTLAASTRHHDWTLPLIFLAILAGQCSSYARSRFRNFVHNEPLSPQV